MNTIYMQPMVTGITGLKTCSDNQLVRCNGDNSSDLQVCPGVFADDSGNLTIGTETPIEGYIVTIDGGIVSHKEVDQNSYPTIYAMQTASTLQDGSAGATTNDEAFNSTYEAIKFIADGNHNIRSFGVRLKVSAVLTNPTGYITGSLHSDNAGTVGALIDEGTMTLYGALTTSYVEYQFGSISQTLASGTSYWLVLKQSVAPLGGAILINRGTTGTALYAYSANGSEWITENGKNGWFKIYGRTYFGVYGGSTNSHGVYGGSTNSYGVCGHSTNSHGVYGDSTNRMGVYGGSTNSYGVCGSSTNSYGVYGGSTNSYGVCGHSTNSHGVYGDSTNSMGVYGGSTNSYGVCGSSTNSYGVYGGSTNSHGVYGGSTNSYGVCGSSTNSYGGYFVRNTATPASAVPVLFVIQNHASDTNATFDVRQNGAGAIIRAFDGTTEVFRVNDGGNVGIRETAPETSIEITSTAPYITLHNSTEEDIEGGREGKIIFKGEQSGGEETVLVAIQASHDGASDDEKADFIVFVNDGNDGSTPTERLRIASDGVMTVSSALKLAYLGGAPASLENGMIWMETDGLHIYYAGAEKIVAGV